MVRKDDFSRSMTSPLGPSFQTSFPSTDYLTGCPLSVPLFSISKPPITYSRTDRSRRRRELNLVGYIYATFSNRGFRRNVNPVNATAHSIAQKCVSFVFCTFVNHSCRRKNAYNVVPVQFARIFLFYSLKLVGTFKY